MNEYRFIFIGKILYSTKILIYFSKYAESIEDEMLFKYIFFCLSMDRHGQCVISPGYNGGIIYLKSEYQAVLLLES